jgi:sulfur-carrier protein
VSVEVIFTNFLTKLVDGEKILYYNPGKLSEILEEIAEQYPIFKREVFDKNGNLKSHLSLFINDKDYRKLSGIDTFVKDNQKIKIYMALVGG